MKIYAFDVDDTLEVSGGPISIKSVGSLKSDQRKRLRSGSALTAGAPEELHSVRTGIIIIP